MIVMVIFTDNGVSFGTATAIKADDAFRLAFAIESASLKYKYNLIWSV